MKKIIFVLFFVVLLFSYASASGCARGLVLVEEQHVPVEGVELVFVQHGNNCESMVVLINEGTQSAHDVEMTIWTGNQQQRSMKKDFLEPQSMLLDGLLIEAFGRYSVDSVRVTATSNEGATAEAVVKLGPDTSSLIDTILIALLIITAIGTLLLYKFAKNKDLAIVAFAIWLIILMMNVANFILLN